MPLYYSNFKSFSNKISRIFWFEQLYTWPLLAILKGQYRPWAELGRPVQGWYWWISTLWCHRKLPPCERGSMIRLNVSTCVKKGLASKGSVLNKTVKGDLGLNEETTAPLKFSNIYPPHFLVFYYLSQTLPIIGIPNPTGWLGLLHSLR